MHHDTTSLPRCLRPAHMTADRVLEAGKLWHGTPMIEIVSYRADWPADYRSLAAALRAALGDAPASLHHIGSTAVPGLAAKDIIDIQLTLPSLDAVPDPVIAAAGYTPRGRVFDHNPPGQHWSDADLEKRYFKSRGRPAHLHVRATGRRNQRYPLLCRDYLRHHPMAAEAYGELKRRLADQFAERSHTYSDIKDPAVDLIMAAAEDWAAATGWTLPPED